jgi:hypothetical protein
MVARGLTAADTDALLFTSPRGSQLRYTNWLRWIWYPACVATGLGRMVKDPETGRTSFDGLGFHELRKNTGTGLVAAGNRPEDGPGLPRSRRREDHAGDLRPGRARAGKQAAAATGGRFMPPTERHERAIARGTAGEDTEA